MVSGDRNHHIPPSARPPQEKRMTWSPAARRGSKFRHPCVYSQTQSAPQLHGLSPQTRGNLTTVLTTSIESATSICFPLVTISNFSPALPSHAFNCTGIKFSRKSPAVGSINRHCPSADFTLAEEKARVAVSSRTLASAAALGSRTAPARDTGIADWGTVSVFGASISGVGDGVGEIWVGPWAGPWATAVVIGVEIDADAGAGAGRGALGAGTADEVAAGPATPPPLPKVKD